MALLRFAVMGSTTFDFSALHSLADGWDGPGSCAPDRDCLRRAERLAAEWRVRHASCPAAKDLCAVPDGSVAMYLTLDGLDAALMFASDGAIEASVYSTDAATLLAVESDLSSDSAADWLDENFGERTLEPSAAA